MGDQAPAARVALLPLLVGDVHHHPPVCRATSIMSMGPVSCGSSNSPFSQGQAGGGGGRDACPRADADAADRQDPPPGPRPSARCSLRISAQSSTDNTPSPQLGWAGLVVRGQHSRRLTCVLPSRLRAWLSVPDTRAKVTDQATSAKRRIRKSVNLAMAQGHLLAIR